MLGRWDEVLATADEFRRSTCIRRSRAQRPPVRCRRPTATVVSSTRPGGSSACSRSSRIRRTSRTGVRCARADRRSAARRGAAGGGGRGGRGDDRDRADDGPVVPGREAGVVDALEAALALGDIARAGGAARGVEALPPGQRPAVPRGARTSGSARDWRATPPATGRRAVRFREPAHAVLAGRHAARARRGTRRRRGGARSSPGRGRLRAASGDAVARAGRRARCREGRRMTCASLRRREPRRREVLRRVRRGAGARLPERPPGCCRSAVLRRVRRGDGRRRRLRRPRPPPPPRPSGATSPSSSPTSSASRRPRRSVTPRTRASCSPRYFDTCRRLIERYGGTVEKFIGDAVMAVWGTPVANEDDAERAVRAALDLVAAVPELDPALAARAGVLTGEVAVTLGAEGQGMVAGDLVNTAARIQGEAEPGTVLVGESTKRATEAAIAYEDAGEHELKGKAEPVALFRALRVTAARAGALKSTGLEPPFVGRDRELRLVKELFHASAEEKKAHLVSVVGIAGIGKSRLAWEFEKYIDGLVDEIWWHRGRCLAYGEGVAYWALAEMVRMRARIGEEEPRRRRPRRSCGTRVEQHVPDAEERAWLEPRLAQLLGLGEATTRRPAGAVLRLAALLRAARRAGAVRARVRGPPVGRARPARLHRPRARVVAEAPAVRARSLATRDRRGARRRVAQRDDARARAAQRRGDGCAARRIRAGAARRAPRGDPRPRRGRSALRGRDRADAARPRPARARAATRTARRARSRSSPCPRRCTRCSRRASTG